MSHDLKYIGMDVHNHDKVQEITAEMRTLLNPLMLTSDEFMELLKEC